MSFERHRVWCSQGVHLHVFHNSEDVTGRCRFADDTGDGMAELFLHDISGKPYYDANARDLATEIVHGVTFREGAPF
jgi:hypothetical protein